VSAAAKAKLKPVFTVTSGVSQGNDYFITKSGILVNIFRSYKQDEEQQYNITTVTPKGKVSKFTVKGPSLNVSYASDGKEKEVFYVSRPEKEVTALNMSLKKVWERKLGKYDGYAGTISKVDGSYQISKTEKLTIDGEKVKVKNINPRIKRIGKYEYRVNEKEQTVQKTDKETGKVLWNKRAFDLIDKNGKSVPAGSMRFAFFDDKGNVYATVNYPTDNYQSRMVAVSNSGKMSWNKKGHITPGQIVGDVLCYYYEEPMIMDGYINDYDIIIANKNTGKTIKTFGPAGPLANWYDLKIRDNNLYVVGETFAEIYNSKGKVIASYKSPKGRAIFGHSFDNKNNLYLQSGFNPGTKDQRGWVFTYSPKGKLISKKAFDQKNYNLVLIDPSGKQNYQIKKIKGKNYKETIEFYRYN